MCIVQGGRQSALHTTLQIYYEKINCPNHFAKK